MCAYQALLIHSWLIPASHYIQSLHPKGAIFITILMYAFRNLTHENDPLTVSTFKHNNVTCSTGKKGFKRYMLF